MRAVNQNLNRYKHRTLESELFSKITADEKTGCHIFNGPVNDNGYGRFQFRGQKIYAHRKSYELAKGEIPVGYVIRHMCHNPLCCNPFHLEIGTQTENCNDTFVANRQAKGTKIPQSKLNETKVLEIRKLYAEGMKQKKLAKMYGIDRSQISRVVNRKDWRWL